MTQTVKGLLFWIKGDITHRVDNLGRILQPYETDQLAKRVLSMDICQIEPTGNVLITGEIDTMIQEILDNQLITPESRETVNNAFACAFDGIVLLRGHFMKHNNLDNQAIHMNGILKNLRSIMDNTGIEDQVANSVMEK